MRLMMFEKAKGAALGLVEGKSVIDLAAVEASLPRDLKALIAVGSGMLHAVKAAAAKAPSASASTMPCTPRRVGTPFPATLRSSCGCRPPSSLRVHR